MNILACIFLGSFVFFTVLAVFTIFRDSKSDINRVFFIYLLLIAFVCFCRFALCRSATMADAVFWLKAVSVLMVIPAFYAHFIYLYTRKQTSYAYHNFLYFPPLFFFALDAGTHAISGTPVLMALGWMAQQPPVSMIYCAYFAWVLSIVVLTIYWTVNYYREPSYCAAEKDVKRYLIFLTVFSVFTLFSRFLSHFMLRDFPFLQPFSVAVLVMVQAYGVWKHRLVDPTPENASEDIIKLMPEALFILSPKNEIVRVNDAALNMLRYTIKDLLYYPFENIVGDSDNRACACVQDILSRSSIENQEVCMKKKDGSTITVLLSKSPVRGFGERRIGSIVVARDLTFRKQAEAQLANAQKLKTVGTLAAGIAHDLNNFLTCVTGNITLAKMPGIDPERILKLLTDAEKAVFLASGLSKKLLTFAKGNDPVLKITALPDLIRDSADLAIRGAPVQCEFSIPDDLWAAQIDAGQISQVITNVIINAKQAMPRGGRINVCCENAAYSGETLLHGRAGSFVKIAVHDEGIGISEKNLKKIFEPFFTTKETGTGLGLGICNSIVKKHNGFIDLASKVGAGTTVTIFLPAEADIRLGVAYNEPATFRGSGRILVMDDESLVRECCCELLKSSGYEVVPAMDGGDAIEKYLHAFNNKTPFDAVILDLTVSVGVGGKDAVKRLIEIDPNIIAIATSGYNQDPVMANFKEHGFIGVLPKPYTLQNVVEVLSCCLNRNVVS